MTTYIPTVGDRVWYLHGYGDLKSVGLVATVVHRWSDGSLNLHVLDDGVHARWGTPSKLVTRVIRAEFSTDFGCWSDVHPDGMRPGDLQSAAPDGQGPSRG